MKEKQKLLITDNKSNNSEIMRNKQIEKMARDQINGMVKVLEATCDESETCICNCDLCKANALYNAGYRKQSENMVEVVRCKDCINRVEFDKDKYHCELTGYYCGETGYCSDGVRR